MLNCLLSPNFCLLFIYSPKWPAISGYQSLKSLLSERCHTVALLKFLSLFHLPRLSKPEVLRQKILCFIWINICDHTHP